MTMLDFAKTADEIAATTKKLQKTALVAAYLRSLPVEEAATAAIFLSGRPFPAYEERTLQVGGTLIWRVIGELSGKSEHEMAEIYRRRGDAGSVAAEALAERPASWLPLTEVERAFSAIAASHGASVKAALLRQLLDRATPLEAKYIVKIISGDLRIGLKQSLVEEAIARAFEVRLDQVKRGNMLLGDLGETLRLASTGKLADACLRLFHPIDFMLASPVESPKEALSCFPNASVEDKYDGIRAQAHSASAGKKLAPNSCEMSQLPIWCSTFSMRTASSSWTVHSASVRGFSMIFLPLLVPPLFADSRRSRVSTFRLWTRTTPIKRPVLLCFELRSQRPVHPRISTACSRPRAIEATRAS
jgi:DNA ligase-1